jgi:hypothetical protein
MSTDKEKPVRSGVGTRLLALVALTVFGGGVAYAVREVYRAATDSFIAPIILSPDNDMVLANKVKMSELYIERARTIGDADAIDGELAAGEKAVARLRELKAAADTALAWTIDINARQGSAGAVDLGTLARQRQVLSEMFAKEQQLARESHANLQAGLISKTDYAKELQSLDQVQMALLENERTRVQSELLAQQVSLARRSLSSQGGVPAMPEVILRQDQMVRIELDLLKLETEMSAKRADKRLVANKLAKIDELEAQLNARPIFRAIEKSMDIAFVPYTQISGVEPDARVYCCVWGLFHCRDVGRVAEVVPGEVILPDPWGTQARGQYAVLDLRDHDSAMSRTLRVRGATASEHHTTPSAPMNTDRGKPLSVR